MKKLALVLSALLAQPGCVTVAKSQNFTPYHVSGDLYRGPQPQPGDVKALQAMGIKTLVDLNDIDIVPEQLEAKDAGINFRSYPLSGFWEPSDANVDAALAAMKEQPAYVHCEYGHDRTGLLVGLYRVEVDGWSAKDAYAEMLKMGFHPTLLGLQFYWDKRTAGK